MYAAHPGGPVQSSQNGFSDRLWALSLASAGQLVVIAAVAFVLSVRTDDYDVGHGGAPAAAGLLCALFFAPFVLPFLGLLHSLLLMWPASALAGRISAGVGGNHLLWSVGLSLALGAGYAGLLGPEWWWASATGVLPLLGGAYAQRHGLGGRRMAGRTTAAAAVASVLVLAAGAVATANGLIEEYRPPTLTPAKYQGTWRGGMGAELVLGAHGGATVRNLPREAHEAHEADDSGNAVCDGPASWRFEPADDTHRDRAVIENHACGEMAWEITGTEARPALFILLGDPDAGDVRILHKQPG